MTQPTLSEFEPDRCSTSSSPPPEEIQEATDQITNPARPTHDEISSVRKALISSLPGFDELSHAPEPDTPLTVYQEFISASPGIEIKDPKDTPHRICDVTLERAPFPELWIQTKIGDKVHIYCTDQVETSPDSVYHPNISPYLSPRTLSIEFLGAGSRSFALTNTRTSFCIGARLAILTACATANYREQYTEPEFDRRSEMLLAAVYGWEMLEHSRQNGNTEPSVSSQFKAHSTTNGPPVLDNVDEGVVTCLESSLEANPEIEYQPRTKAATRSLPKAIDPNHPEFTPVSDEYTIKTDSEDRISAVQYKHPLTGNVSTVVDLNQYEQFQKSN